MAKARKPLEQNKKHFTKKEIEERRYQEDNSKITREMKAPNWLDKRAVKVFNEVVHHLDKIKILDDLDVHNLAIYSDTYIRIIDIVNDIQKNGMIITTEDTKGNLKTTKNPAVDIHKTLTKTLIDYSKILGLPSIERPKLIVFDPTKEMKDPFEEFDI